MSEVSDSPPSLKGWFRHVDHGVWDTEKLSRDDTDVVIAAVGVSPAKQVPSAHVGSGDNDRRNMLHPFNYHWTGQILLNKWPYLHPHRQRDSISYVDLVRDQNLDDILRTAWGEYQVSIDLNPFDNAFDDNVFEWCRNPEEFLGGIATAQFYGVANTVMKSTLRRWKRIKEFAYAMLDAILSSLDGLEEPAVFVSALRNPPSVNIDTRWDCVVMSLPVEKLAFSISLYRIFT